MAQGYTAQLSALDKVCFDILHWTDAAFHSALIVTSNLRDQSNAASIWKNFLSRQHILPRTAAAYSTLFDNGSRVAIILRRDLDLYTCGTSNKYKVFEFPE